MVRKLPPLRLIIRYSPYYKYLIHIYIYIHGGIFLGQFMITRVGGMMFSDCPMQNYGRLDWMEEMLPMCPQQRELQQSIYPRSPKPYSYP